MCTAKYENWELSEPINNLFFCLYILNVVKYIN